MFDKIFETEPFFINEEGTKWWKDESSTSYAYRTWKYEEGTIQVYLVETVDSMRTRIVVYKDKAIYESQQLDAIGTFIDFFAVSKNIKRRY